MIFVISVLWTLQIEHAHTCAYVLAGLDMKTCIWFISPTSMHKCLHARIVKKRIFALSSEVILG